VSDAELIARARLEPAAFAPIFDRHYATIHAYLRRRLDAPIAEELAAETFARALRSVARYDEERADALPWPQIGLAALADAARPRELGQCRAHRRFRRRGPRRDADGSHRPLLHRRREVQHRAAARLRPHARGALRPPALARGRPRPVARRRGLRRDRRRAARGPADARACAPRSTARSRSCPACSCSARSATAWAARPSASPSPSTTGLRQELRFDPQTAEVLNERQVVAHAVQGLRAAPGTVIEDIVYTKRAVTDATTRP
jgi:DNA-directed RNA polymerase specialized sigma24 family protein